MLAVRYSCFLCQKDAKDGTPVGEGPGARTQLPHSKKTINSVLLYLARSIKSDMEVPRKARICHACFQDLVEFDKLKVKLRDAERRLTQMMCAQRPRQLNKEGQRKLINVDEDNSRLNENGDASQTQNVAGSIIVASSDEEAIEQIDGGMSLCSSDEFQMNDCIEKRHTEEQTDFTTGSGTDNKIVATSGRQPVECLQCGQHFKSLTQLKYHIVAEHTEKGNTCAECGFQAKDEEYLELHMNVHVGKTEYECRYCPNRYTRKVNVIRHMHKHWNKQKFQCEKCGERFPLVNMLYNHRQIHEAEENPLICTICNQTFKSRKTFTRHGIVHREDRPRYYCPSCPKSFTERYTLKMHKRTHGAIEEGASEDLSNCSIPTGSKGDNTAAAKLCEEISIDEFTFTCIVCDAHFETRTVLKAHLEKDHDAILE